MELIIGNELTLNGTTYQNHTLEAADFLPFGFSGGVINRQGDNITATLVFPNTALTRSWIHEAIDAKWVARVKVKLLSPVKELYSYVGQVSAGNWDDTRATLQLSTVLDAVDGDIPFRTLTTDLVGPLPTSGNLYLS
jgi:hypothetical protein